MTNEIKEILDILTFNKEDILNKICSVEDFVSREQIIKLLDYITNLQQRIDKAVEYINNEYDVEPHELYGLVSADELLNILRGDE
jgi:ASC-1-like (ASCH) protein